MLPYQLFFGFCLSKDEQENLQNIPSSTRDLFIQTHDPAYLHLVEDSGKVYLGKFLGDKTNLHQIESMQAHILSVLKKLNAELVPNSRSLGLFALPVTESFTSDVF